MQTSITDQPQDSSQTWAYNCPRREPVSPSRRRALLYLAAVLFGGATAFYSIFWLVLRGSNSNEIREHTDDRGAAFAYQPTLSGIRVEPISTRTFVTIIYELFTVQ